MYKKRDFLSKLLLPQKELEKYYRDEREYQYENNIAIRGIKIRKKLHKLFLGILRLECLLSGIKIKVIKDDRIPTDRPVIYACTHIGRYDIESAFLSIKEHCYGLMGDPGKVYRNADGLLLNLNGMIFIDTAYKKDRFVGKETCIKLLGQGCNLLIYPEGAWNITENQVVMKLFTGTVEMAIRSGAEIVPIALEQYENTYYVNIGSNIDWTNSGLEQKHERTAELRDILCTLKWEIWERKGITNRGELPSDYADIFLDEIMKQTSNDYTVEEINRTRYRDETDVEVETVLQYFR